MMLRQYLGYLLAFAILCPDVHAGNVTYTDAERRIDANAILFDRNGDLYPPASVKLDGEQVLFGRGDSIASLKEHYREAAKENPDEWQALLTATGVKNSAEFDATWLKVQGSLRKETAGRLNRIVADGSALVLLIHGYNNTYEQAHWWYSLVEPDIRAKQPKVAIVRVYWDGLTDGGLRSNPANIWGDAQWNFPLVGVELRRLLADADGVSKLRVLTHSSGGPLIANALGNASKPFERDREAPGQNRQLDDYFAKAAGKIAGYGLPSIADIRVAMIAPAASMNTFEHFGSGWYRLDKLVLGANRKDVADSKGFLSCSAVGATCLTTRPQESCDVLRKRLASVKTSIFDFSGSKDSPKSFYFWDAHGVDAYQQREDWDAFLSHWLLDAPTMPDESAAVCKE